MLKHYALVLEYCGTDYCGWQKQTDSLGVQTLLEKALSSVANEAIEVVCAGRTDARVHATAQVVNFSTAAVRKDRAWILGTNMYMPKDIQVMSIHPVEADFSARFSAKYRRYQYVIHQSEIKSALWFNRVTWVNRPLDLDLMNKSCQYLIGEHDFSAFRSSQCQSPTANRFIHHAFFRQHGSLIIFDIKGNAFLHHMVRNIVGSILEVGQGKHLPEWIDQLLEQRNRRLSGKTAPSEGLYLIEVGYDEDLKINSKRPVLFDTTAFP